MLKSLNRVREFEPVASDGEVGSITDFLFDDERWTVRYMIVSTGAWLGREVLITPVSVRRIDAPGRRIELSISREQVRNSPAANTAAPLSREFEAQYFAHYGYSPYWFGTSAWGAGVYPGALASATAAEAARTRAQDLESHLRRTSAVAGYHLRASDGVIGHVDDFLMEQDTWRIRYLNVDTSNWLGGKSVLIGTDAAGPIDWSEGLIKVNMPREDVRNSREVPQEITS